jgi:outer membrane protein OmpA-like peptidoglycan-associated protein
MTRILRFSAPLLAGCSHDLVVVLPDADGHIGGVVVQTGDGKTVLLDKAYASDAPGDGKAGTAAAGDVEKDFADVMAARPIPPVHHKLFFPNDSDEMTDASKTEYNKKVFADVKRRGAAEIIIVGHTDAVGGLEYNDKLSLGRAEAIKLKLLSERKSDLPADMNITTDGRGKRDDKDADGTANPNERYVDIIVQ